MLRNKKNIDFLSAWSHHHPDSLHTEEGALALNRKVKRLLLRAIKTCLAHQGRTYYVKMQSDTKVSCCPFSTQYYLPLVLMLYFFPFYLSLLESQEALQCFSIRSHCFRHFSHADIGKVSFLKYLSFLPQRQYFPMILFLPILLPFQCLLFFGENSFCNNYSL